MRQRVVAYIDGFNLHFGLRSAGWDRLNWLDVCRLIQSLLKPSQELRGVKYFTARLSSPGRRYLQQKAFLEANEAVGTCTFYYGQFQPGGSVCPRCGLETNSPKEKRTDVNIAVEMLSDAYRNAFDTALLVSGDSDLSPALSKIHELTTKRVVVAFPPKRKSLHLTQVAHAHFVIGYSKLLASQLPDQVTTPEGSIVVRPPTKL